MSIVTKPVILDETGKQINERLREIRNAIVSGGKGIIYGFHVDPGESDPAAAVTYLEDAVGMTPAAMDYTNDVFQYGSWKDAFFMPKPCMLKYDGTVAYYLDPNNYGKKTDGTTSDVDDDTFGGNAMMEWGQNGKIIWYKILPDATPTGASVYIADHQADDGYKAYSFINNQGELVDHFYTPIYNGTLDGDGKLRSISGKANSALCNNKTAAQEVTAAELNNPSTDKLWYTEVLADATLINLLLILIGKSLNTQAVFGNGRISQSAALTSCLGTGTMDTKGLFWGDNDNDHGVKVFGMENWWANQWRRYAGHIFVNNVHKYKMTRGTEDGSTASDYNTDATGYLTGPSGPSSNNYITTHEFNADGMFAKAVGGTDSTYYCDYLWQNSGTRYAYRGGGCSDGLRCGAFFVNLYAAPSDAAWAVGAAPSCKPLS